MKTELEKEGEMREEFPRQGAEGQQPPKVQPSPGFLGDAGAG